MQAQFKVPEPGVVPRLGDILNARHLFELQVGGGWTVKVHANYPDDAVAIATRAGYVPSAVRQIGDDA
jgi:hypothetical protein